MRAILLGVCLFHLSCKSPNPDPLPPDFPQGTWVNLRSEIFDIQGNKIGSFVQSDQECKNYLRVTSDSMEFLDPGTAMGEAAKSFSRCYSRLKSPYTAIRGGGWKRGRDSVFADMGKLVLLQQYATLSGIGSLRTRKTYYEKIKEREIDLSKCGCFNNPPE